MIDGFRPGDVWRVTGYTNAVRALAVGVESLWGQIDKESFDRLAELRGDAPVDEIENGFIIRGYDDLQRLCEIANVVIAIDPENGLVKAYDPNEWISVH